METRSFFGVSTTSLVCASETFAGGEGLCLEDTAVSSCKTVACNHPLHGGKAPYHGLRSFECGEGTDDRKKQIKDSLQRCNRYSTVRHAAQLKTPNVHLSISMLFAHGSTMGCGVC